MVLYGVFGVDIGAEPTYNTMSPVNQSHLK